MHLYTKKQLNMREKFEKYALKNKEMSNVKKKFNTFIEIN